MSQKIPPIKLPCKHPDGCRNNASKDKDGWCKMHYIRIKRYGSPGPVGTMKDAIELCEHPSGDCKRKIFLGKYCRLHYKRLKEKGSLGPVAFLRRENRTKIGENCLVNGCKRTQIKYGYCSMHHSRFCKNGDPGEVETRKFQDNAPTGYKTCQNKDCQIKIQLLSNFNKKSKLRQDFVSYCKTCTREEFVVRKYKITKDEYRKLMLNAKCEMCGSVENLAIDHCHKTNKVRGVLCDLCNRGIGLLGENLNILLAAYDYLIKHQETTK